MNSSSGSTGDIYCSEQSSFNWLNKKLCGMLLLCYAVRLRYCVFCFCQSLTNLLRSTTQNTGGKHNTDLSSVPLQPHLQDKQWTTNDLSSLPSLSSGVRREEADGRQEGRVISAITIVCLVSRYDQLVSNIEVR